MSNTNVIQMLQAAKAKVRKGTEAYDLVIPARDEVLARYQPMFQVDCVEQLSEDEFKSFLLFKNNKHWTGLYRSQTKMCEDMDRLREGLQRLLDESQPIARRYTTAVDMIPGLGRAVATAILTVAYQDRYGVWNNTSEEGMRSVGAWPQFARGLSIGARYEKINEILNQLASDLHVDLWTLDALWHIHLYGSPGPEGEALEEGPDIMFGLERHLHDFLRDNWESTELGKEWTLEVEAGEPDIGYEYPTGVGKIDLLVHSRTNKDLLVVELKRGQTSDETVGQVLRYMGWVRQHVLEQGGRVTGLVIAHSVDDKLRYALRELPDVEIRLYKVDFHLVNDGDT